MDTIQLVRYNGAPVRTVNHSGEMWFCVSDVCERLEIDNARRVAREQLAEDERRTFNVHRQGETWFCNEPGLYRIIFRSNKPEAEKFKRWVFHEVLPSIRRNGQYVDWRREMGRNSKQVELHEAQLALQLAPRRETYLEKAKRAAYLYGELSDDEICTLYRIPKRRQGLFAYTIREYRRANQKRDEHRQEVIRLQRNGGVQ